MSNKPLNIDDTLYNLRKTLYNDCLHETNTDVFNSVFATVTTFLETGFPEYKTIASENLKLDEDNKKMRQALEYILEGLESSLQGEKINIKDIPENQRWIFEKILDTLQNLNNNPIPKEKEELRLYVAIRKDLKIPEGKLIAQVGHAFLNTFLKSDRREEYLTNPAHPKISVWAKNLNALIRAQTECEDAGIACALITDAGRTVFPEPTVTCLGIGPIERSKLPKFVRNFQLLEVKKDVE